MGGYAQGRSIFKNQLKLRFTGRLILCAHRNRVASNSFSRHPRHVTHPTRSSNRTVKMVGNNRVIMGHLRNPGRALDFNRITFTRRVRRNTSRLTNTLTRSIRVHGRARPGFNTHQRNPAFNRHRTTHNLSGLLFNILRMSNMRGLKLANNHNSTLVRRVPHILGRHLHFYGLFTVGILGTLTTNLGRTPTSARNHFPHHVPSVRLFANKTGLFVPVRAGLI